MVYSKRQLVVAALTELGIASSEVELAVPEIVGAANRLDAMMGEWDGRGIHLGYPLTSPDTLILDANSNVPNFATRAVILGLAVELAPQFGLQVLPATATNAKRALETVIGRLATAPLLQFPNTTPAGAGNKPWLIPANPFLQRPDDPITVGEEGDLTFE